MATSCHDMQATICHGFGCIVGNMLQSDAKEAIRANLRLASGGTDTQQFRDRIAKKSGVSPRTIGTMMSDGGNPRLDNIEAVANAIGKSASELLINPNTAKSKSSAGASEADSTTQFVHISPAATRIIERLQQAESAGTSSPKLLALIEAALDLALNSTRPDDYADITHAINNDD